MWVGEKSEACMYMYLKCNFKRLSKFLLHLEEDRRTHQALTVKPRPRIAGRAYMYMYVGVGALLLLSVTRDHSNTGSKVVGIPTTSWKVQ